MADKFIHVVDDFLPDFETVQNVLKNTEFGDYFLNGKKYTGFCNALLPVKLLMEEYLGYKISIQLGHIRKGTKDTPLTHYIHADNYGARRAFVLFLSDPSVETGTAFWTHKELGIDCLPNDCSEELFSRLDNDIKDTSKWEMNRYLPAKKNRAIFFDGMLFHSRHPEHLQIDDSGTPRLNVALFWEPLK